MDRCFGGRTATPIWVARWSITMHSYLLLNVKYSVFWVKIFASNHEKRKKNCTSLIFPLFIMGVRKDIPVHVTALITATQRLQHDTVETCESPSLDKHGLACFPHLPSKPSHDDAHTHRSQLCELSCSMGTYTQRTPSQTAKLAS